MERLSAFTQEGGNMLGAVRGGRYKLKEGKGVSYWRIGGNGRQQWQV